jgi:uncharacterized protein Yka (UPF0111/DUF47 family)
MFGSSRKDEVFYGAFREEARIAVDVAGAFSAMLVDLSSRERYARDIKQQRRSATALLKKTVRLIHTTWITPLDRHQIHELITNLDGVSALTESTASRVVLFGIGEARSESRDLARHVDECCKRVHEVTELLPKLTKEHAERVMTAAGEIHEIEGQADETHRRALATLFDGTSDPLTVMKWREIFDNLEQATNLCRDVSTLFEAIVLESA